MEKIVVKLAERSYPITIGKHLISSSQYFLDHIQSKQVFIITNETVAPLYLSSLKESLSPFIVEELILKDGEKFKNLATFELILSHLLEKKCSRDATIITLGGGVIGDMAGFAAATYQRGINFIQVPTTLLSQVDSSVGGKTAVNHVLGKNMIGAFHQPQAVIIDINSLKTLPERELSAGLAEVIKCAVGYDRDFFYWLEENISAVKILSAPAITYMIKRCCEIKAEIVSLDEKEKGVRALLNLGHTFGHAIEAEQGYGNWLHGEAVAVGLILAGKMSVALGQFKQDDQARLVKLIEKAGLPTLGPKTMKFNQYIKHMQRDKKVKEGKLHFILLTSLGTSHVASNIDEQVLKNVIES